MKLIKHIRNMMFIGAVLSCTTGFSQVVSQTPPVIKAWYSAWEKKDWNSMQQILADGFTFSSPLDDHIHLSVFKERCWPNAYKIKRFDVDKLAVEGDIAFVITTGYTTEGKFFRNTDCFTLKNGKISAYECFFGPGVNYPNSGK